MRRRALAAVLAAAALGVGGCHAAASSAPAAPGTGATAADPLAGIDTRLDTIERGIDADAGAAG